MGAIAKDYLVDLKVSQLQYEILAGC
jgi:hypothetical protein